MGDGPLFLLLRPALLVFKEILHRLSNKDADLQRKIAWFCARVDVDALLFRQYLCDVSTESQFYWLKMTAWPSAFDSGVARPLVYSKSLSLIEKVSTSRGGPPREVDPQVTGCGQLGTWGCSGHSFVTFYFRTSLRFPLIWRPKKKCHKSIWSRRQNSASFGS